jgi:putative ABC transport system permease protein
MLAVGLGFNTALFAVMHDVLLAPLPYQAPDRLVMMWTGRYPDGQGVANSYADYAEWQRRSTSFSGMTAYNIALGTLTGDGDPEEIGGATVSPEFFQILGARLQLGRGIEPGDERVTDVRPIVISDTLWTRRFGRDPGILSRTLTLADRPRRIVGVMAPGYVQPEPFWGSEAEFWSPLTVSDAMRSNHAFGFLRVIARLKDGVELDAAAAEMDGIGRRLLEEFPSTGRRAVVVAPLARELTGDTRPMLWLFFGAIMLVLCLAIANVVNLTLARANARRAELAIRVALGASRARLVTQSIAESTLVGVLGGILGIGIAALGIRLLLPMAESAAPGLYASTVDGVVVLYALGLSTVVGALCGLLPAWRVGRARLTSNLRETKGTSGLEVTRARMWLVAIEAALAVPLLVGATLLGATLVNMQHVDPGFRGDRALQFRLTLAGARYDAAAARTRFLLDAERRLAALPGATAAGSVSSLPLGGLNNTGGSILYERADGTLAELSVGFRAATGGYFRALGVPVSRGRTFTDGPDDRGTVMINERAARTMWGDGDPLGRRIRFGSLKNQDPSNPWLTVVGVTGDLRHEALTRNPNEEIFQPYVENERATMTIVVGTANDPMSLAAPARELMRSLDSKIALVNLGPVSQFVHGQLARPRFTLLCATLLGVVGLALAACGTFAVLSLLVAQRTREIGIRMALGAAPLRVGALMMRESLGPAIVGCAVGGLASAWLNRALSSLLFGITPLDPRVFAAAFAVLALTAAAASWWPTRRAMRVDPLVALRTD